MHVVAFYVSKLTLLLEIYHYELRKLALRVYVRSNDISISKKFYN